MAKSARLPTSSDLSKSVQSMVNIQHTTRPSRLMFVLVYACLHGNKRAGGNCSFPFDCLTRRSSGVSRVFVETTLKATVFSAGLQPVQNRRRPDRPFIKALCFFGDGLPNRSSCTPFRRGYPKPHVRCSSVSPGDPEPHAEWSLSRFTPAHQSGHAQGRRRFCTAFKPPSLDQLSLHNRIAKYCRDPVSQQMSPRGTWLDTTHSIG